ncbi:hypothetical protein BsWGS_06085 [Bradybaena similaris]
MSGLDLDRSKVLSAVGALVQVCEKSKKKDNIIDSCDYVHIQLCLKKIPKKNAAVKLKLPHAIRPSNLEVCLLVKDLDRFDRDYEPTTNHFKDFLRKKGVSSINEVIPLKSLKMEYKPYEAKKNLANLYDVFLADARIMRLLPTLLGKHFYGKKKVPVQVNLEAKDLAKEIHTAIHSSRCPISSKGSSSQATVGNMDMSQPDIAENIIAAANQMSTAVPGGANNIRQLSIKTDLSMSIPIYMAEGGPQDVSLPAKEKPAVVEAEEISTLLDAKVKVYPDGRIRIIKDGEEEKKGKVQKRKQRKQPLQHKKNVTFRKKTQNRKNSTQERKHATKKREKKTTLKRKRATGPKPAGPKPAKRLRTK